MPRLCGSVSDRFRITLRIKFSPDGTRFHEGESALHEEDDDGHDEQEEVVDLLRLRTFVLRLVGSSMFLE